jgi:hypothetical protein
MSEQANASNPELERWLADRQSRLEIVKTTTTPGGMTLDWVPIESQQAGAAIATPPASEFKSSGRKEAAKFELDDASFECGPDGTVPIVRPDISHLSPSVTLKDYLKRRGGIRDNHRDQSTTDPDPAHYFHNLSKQFGSFYGCEAYLNVWGPRINVPAGSGGSDHSILQFWLQNSHGVTQSIEGGWNVDHSLYADNYTHLFIYFTTNDYTTDGDNKGGYNRLQEGWVQHSSPSTTGRVIYPGIKMAYYSSYDGQQFDFQLKFQLILDRFTRKLNWWLEVEGIWVGYYPASLFDPAGLGTVATSVSEGGEVYSGLTQPESTQDQMGSGWKAQAGVKRAAYVRNIQNQIAMDGTMADSAGVAFSDVATPGGVDPYSIVLHNQSPSSWGTFMYVGGQTPAIPPLAAWPTDNVPLPKGDWDGKYWPETQHSRASNNRTINPPVGETTSIRFDVSSDAESVDGIRFDVAIDRPGTDRICFANLTNGSVVDLGPALQHLSMPLAEANQRGFYVCNVQGAHYPFMVVAQAIET